MSGKPAMHAIAAIVMLMLAGLALGQDADQYRVAEGDQLSIRVFGEPDLTLETLRVGPQGVISYPLLGEVRVGGLTAAEIEARLTQRLLDGYLKKPQITVSILEYRQFYVNGEVNKPGGYPFRPGLTVEKAITLAGGFSERASKGKIRLTPEGKAGREQKVELDDPIGPGDIINVGESLF